MSYIKKPLDFETEKLRLSLNEAYRQSDRDRCAYLCNIFDMLTMQRFAQRLQAEAAQNPCGRYSTFGFAANSGKG